MRLDEPVSGMKTFSLRSPAKLNLALKVLRKRPDGYHNLRTIFERINLWDDLTFHARASGDIRIFCHHPQVPLGPKNLIFRAAQLLQKEFNMRQGVSVHLVKRIPVAAGLAGGSSNAAATLLGLNRLWHLNLSLEQLVEYGKRLGSDVPFFLYNCPWALGENRGDAIQPLNFSIRLWHVLVTPRFKMYTREVFGSLNLQLTKPDDNVNILLRSLKQNDLSKVAKFLSNDLESSILQLRPQLAVVMAKLRACDVLGVAFSGSGPSVFGLCRSRSHAGQISLILRRQYRQVFAVNTM